MKRKFYILCSTLSITIFWLLLHYDKTLYTGKSLHEMNITSNQQYKQVTSNVKKHYVKNEVKNSRWIVLAGDSNMKFVFNRIKDTFPVIYSNEINETLISKGFDDKVGSSSRWVDRDIIFYFKNKTQLRISLKFLHGGNSEFNRINTTWTDIRLCDVICDHTKVPSVQHEAFTYETKPDLLWITHGLWALNVDFPKNEINDCNGRSKRTEYLYATNRYLKSIKNDINVIWQTNPSIAWHPKIKKDHVKLDYLCQKKLSSEHQIPLFDVYDYTDKNNHQRMKGDYHYDNYTQQYIIDHIFNTSFITSNQIQ